MSLLDSVYKNVALPPVRYLTKNDAEGAHNIFVRVMSAASRHPQLLRLTRQGPVRHPLLKQTLFDGLEFPNPFGPAAGMDKNATIFPALIALTGVGRVELGCVTLKPQIGNERPRLVRVGAEHLINAMGFPNDGVEAVIRRLSGSLQPPVPIGVQIGKNKATSDANAPAEYGAIVRRFVNVPGKRKLPDYFTINVSSPNTPGLRALQAPEMLESIIRNVITELQAQQRSTRRLLVKLAPDIELSLLDEVIELVEQYDIGGLVLTNTTSERLVHSRYDDRPGGFSGPALFDRSFELVQHAASKLPVNRVLVGCGGVNSPERVWQMLQYADLVDSYTALVLEGPHLFRSAVPYVVKRMQERGATSLLDVRAANRPPARQTV